MVYKFGNFEAEIDNTDADFLEKYIEQMRRLADVSNSMGEASDNIAALRQGCEAVDAAVNSLFGEGAAERMFNGRKSYREHIAALVELHKVLNDTSELNTLTAEIASVAGHHNRATRRAAKKKA